MSDPVPAERVWTLCAYNFAHKQRCKECPPVVHARDNGEPFKRYCRAHAERIIRIAFTGDPHGDVRFSDD